MEPDDPRLKKKRRAFALAGELGIKDRGDRLAFAGQVLRREVTTWRFVESEWDLLIAGLLGAIAGLELARQAGRLRDDMRETG